MRIDPNYVNREILLDGAKKVMATTIPEDDFQRSTKFGRKPAFDLIGSLLLRKYRPPIGHDKME